MNVATEQEAYLEAVRRALADLDPAVRDELLEDLPEHFAEVAAEGDATLTERLGPPEAYAAELRMAAGLDVATTPAARGLDDRVSAVLRRARGVVGAADRRTGPLLGYGRASEFLRMLAPGWWVLRGYLAAMAITWLTSDGNEAGLLPRLGGSTLAAALLLAVCLVASIWLGRREPTLASVPRTGLAIGGVALVLFGMVVFDKADQYGGGWNEPQSVSGNPYEYIQDVYVYDSNGNPLTDVSLYDQGGNPIQLGDPYRCQEAFYQAQAGAPAYPYCPNQQPYVVAPRPGLAPTEEPQRTELPLSEVPVETPGPTSTPAPTATPTATAVPTPTN
ncbi:hypothetical protein Ais01nite_40280 [Asanoa ishikariensis]|uniref:Uncharacterized protein n=1 Tax=Asanoa ishikariensis TaxID=137265 RepID=A0A1H3M950_9ACTN|nr:hypothetical protein [Asanoa ishikariensis]GIF65993.1 hypothetical protein Ais01nite_40280 [Asanoa ishikariensis]SDY73242.1 hypothetical protein SAMN05421684_1264 [Asanoa ishikariensis]